MKLISLNKFTSFLILLSFLLPLKAEEEIDIWSKKEKNQNIEQIQNQNKKSEQKLNFELINKPKKNEIEIQSEISLSEKDEKLFGIYDPAENGFDLEMWAQTDAEKVRSSFKRINKINLSNTATKLFEDTILSFAYPPKGMEQKEFVNLKINWMMNNKKIDLIEKSLKQNNEFFNKMNHDI